jgi:hypothetical protein
MRIELTKKFKNEIHGIIADNGLNPDLFQWEVTGSDFNTHTVEDPYGPLTSRQEPDTVNSLAIKIDHQPYFFTFDQQHAGKYCTSMRPAIEKGDKVRVDTRPLLLHCFEEWLSIIKYELEEPDLWKTPFAELGNYDSSESYDTPFTEPETEQIKAALKDIKQKFVAKVELKPEPLAKLEKDFARLEQKLDEHMSKVDFKNILVGTIFHIFIAPWIAPYADVFKDTVVQTLRPLLDSVLRGLDLKN